MGDTTTTASTYQTVGPTATLSVSAGQEVTAYVSGNVQLPTGCTLRVQNTSTSTTLIVTTVTSNSFLDVYAVAAVDTAPSDSTPNTYALQMRSADGNACRWHAPTTGAVFATERSSRGFIATVTG